MERDGLFGEGRMERHSFSSGFVIMWPLQIYSNTPAFVFKGRSAQGHRWEARSTLIFLKPKQQIVL